MKTFSGFFTIKNVNLIYLAFFLLLFPALLINLGVLPLLADEPTRALVALEMYFSDNYIVPTINGDYYYNKPPLYNWLLVGLYHITGRIDEWIIRIPTVISILLFSGIILFWVRKYTDTKTAVFTVMAYITCGRVLFYDSFLGLIDTLFSALIFLNFMLVYHFDRKNDYLRLFLFSYLIITICFFLKGLPAIVFQAITLATLAYLRKKMKFLFSSYHIYGVTLFISVLAVYYAQYLKYNSLDTLFSTLYSESAKRTAIEHGIINSIVHLFAFPLETILHFLPWTVPLILLIKKRTRIHTTQNDFLRFVLWITYTNLLVYWLSPETRPRYLFMFLPLLFILSYSILTHELNTSFKKVFETILLVLLTIICTGVLVIHFLYNFSFVEHFYYKIAIVFIALCITTLFYFYTKEYRFFLFCIALLSMRIGFNWLAIPARIKSDPEQVYKEQSIYVGRYTKGHDLLLYNYTPMNHDASFYISRERGTILKHTQRKGNNIETLKKGTFYLTDVLPDVFANATIHYQFRISYNNTLIYLVKIEDEGQKDNSK